jgi:hypothetical protein
LPPYVVGLVCDARGADPTCMLETLYSIILQAQSEWHLSIAYSKTDLPRTIDILKDYASRESSFSNRRERITLSTFPTDLDRIEVQRHLALVTPAAFVMNQTHGEILCHDALNRVMAFLNDRPFTLRIHAPKGTLHKGGRLEKIKLNNEEVLISKKELFLNGLDGWKMQIEPTLAGKIHSPLVYAPYVNKDSVK